MKSILNLMLLVMLLLFAEAPLNAQTIGRKIEWQVAAITCTPTSKTIKENKYSTSGGTLSFKQEKTGQLIFTSPIAKPLPAGKYSIGGKVKIADDKRSYNAQSIVISLRKKDIKTGAVQTILQTEGINKSQLNSLDYQTIFSSFPKAIQFNFDKFTYWMQISIQRKDPANNSVVSSIQLVRQVG